MFATRIPDRVLANTSLSSYIVLGCCKFWNTIQLINSLVLSMERFAWGSGMRPLWFNVASDIVLWVNQLQGLQGVHWGKVPLVEPHLPAPPLTDYAPFGWRRGHPVLTPGWEGGRIMPSHFNRADTAVNLLGVRTPLKHVVEKKPPSVQHMPGPAIR